MSYYNQNGSRFKGNDGRIYRSDVMSTKTCSNIIRSQENSIYQKCKMSAQQLFDVEYYLAYGKRAGMINIKDKKRIVNEYSLERNNGKGNFIGDPEIIYSILKEKYPEAMERFPNHDGKGYKRIVYAVYYGEAPCTVIKLTD